MISPMQAQDQRGVLFTTPQPSRALLTAALAGIFAGLLGTEWLHSGPLTSAVTVVAQRRFRKKVEKSSKNYFVTVFFSNAVTRNQC
jgi:hypothetical protein